MDLIVTVRISIHIFSAVQGIMLVYAVILEIPQTVILQFRPKPVSSGLDASLDCED